MTEPEHDEPRIRIIADEPSPGRCVITVIRRDAETDKLSNAEIVAKFDEWRRSQRHLRVVDDE